MESASYGRQEGFKHQIYWPPRWLCNLNCWKVFPYNEVEISWVNQQDKGECSKMGVQHVSTLFDTQMYPNVGLHHWTYKDIIDEWWLVRFGMWAIPRNTSFLTNRWFMMIYYFSRWMRSSQWYSWWLFSRCFTIWIGLTRLQKILSLHRLQPTWKWISRWLGYFSEHEVNVNRVLGWLSPCFHIRLAA